MTSFGTLFTQLFKQKSKRVYSVLIIQLAATLVTLIIGAISGAMSHSRSLNYFQIATGPKGAVTINPFSGWLLGFIGIFLGYCIFANIVYFINSSIKNEKINSSQTWRLVPMNDGLIYITNTLSTFCSFVYLMILQMLVILIGGFVVYGTSGALRHEITIVLQGDRFSNDIAANLGSIMNTICSLLIFFIILGLSWYILVSFLHFTTRAVIDFLPAVSSKFILFIIRFVILIIGVFLLETVIGWIFNILTQTLYVGDEFAGTVWGMNLGLTIFSLILVLINFYLINNFFEAKQNN